ncbi:MAG: ABC transporter ATP-binding protein [Candidatus Krumholzibacteria bacterium]|nr:ABC transporter ATP-binding protein [Candidatus Krumholzibacteria bacterium]
MNDPAIRVEGISKSHGAAVALSSVSFAVERGEMFGLIGPDGAGKTTLMRILTSLIDADEGEAWVLGFPVRSGAARVREAIGYMPQHFSLYSDLTVAENIRFFADLFGVAKEARVARTEELLDFSRLGPFVKRRAGALSGGMKQKLALSCALVHTPRVLVLDEPTTGVDPVSRRDFWDMLERLRAQGVTVVVSTPYMNEASLCRHMVFIHKGRILASGTVGEITALFRGTVFSVEGPNLQAISTRLKNAVEPELVRILGDAVQVLALGRSREEVGALLETMRQGGVVSHSREIPPGVEDTFVSLMRE